MNRARLAFERQAAGAAPVRSEEQDHVFLRWRPGVR
jgi:hypothetical protein